jgi:hypothetical protein
MCFPFFPQDSEGNKEDEWKVVFAMPCHVLGDGREQDAEKGGMEMNNVFSFLSSG